MRFYREAIGDKYPICDNIWAAANGLKLLIQDPNEDAKQNWLFNGWKHTHNINCVFVFSPDGKIWLCLINVSGTFHDSTIADYGVYEGMEKVYSKTGAKVVIGLAFKIGNKDYLVKSSQQDPTDGHALLLNISATSIW